MFENFNFHVKWSHPRICNMEDVEDGHARKHYLRAVPCITRCMVINVPVTMWYAVQPSVEQLDLWSLIVLPSIQLHQCRISTSLKNTSLRALLSKETAPVIIILQNNLNYFMQWHVRTTLFLEYFYDHNLFKKLQWQTIIQIYWGLIEGLMSRFDVGRDWQLWYWLVHLVFILLRKSLLESVRLNLLVAIINFWMPCCMQFQTDRWADTQMKYITLAEY